jgi:hypothetical protein
LAGTRELVDVLGSTSVVAKALEALQVAGLVKCAGASVRLASL